MRVKNKRFSSLVNLSHQEKLGCSTYFGLLYCGDSESKSKFGSEMCVVLSTKFVVICYAA